MDVEDSAPAVAGRDGGPAGDRDGGTARRGRNGGPADKQPACPDELWPVEVTAARGLLAPKARAFSGKNDGKNGH